MWSRLAGGLADGIKRNETAPTLREGHNNNSCNSSKRSNGLQMRKPRHRPSSVHESRPPPSTVFLSSTSTRDEPQSLDREAEKQFDMMNITVVVYGLSGVVCQKNPPMHRKKDPQQQANCHDLASEKSGASSRGWSTSTSVSGNGGSNQCKMEILGDDAAPTTAVVSVRKNAFSSKTSMETFLPSVPLNVPVTTSGAKFRYNAAWPSHQSDLVKDDSSLARSSFDLIRTMEQESFTPGECQAGAVSNYVHETIDINIHLSRGTELVPLGTASVVVSGDEEGEVQTTVSVKPFKYKNGKILPVQRFKSKKLSKQHQYGYLNGDPTSRYFLDENATLRVGVRVIPETTLKRTMEREQTDQNMKQLLQRIGDDHMRRAEYNYVRQTVLQTLATNNNNSNMAASETPMHDIMPGLFCGVLDLEPAFHRRERQAAAHVPKEILAKNETQYPHLGIVSVLSSVSESTFGSEESDIENEYGLGMHLPPPAGLYGRAYPPR